MDNVELSHPTRWGMVLTGLLQGLVCYLLMTWLVPGNRDWLFYGIPSTVAISSVLLFSVITFRQRKLWGWLAVVFVAVLAMSGWLKWQSEGINSGHVDSQFFFYGCNLLLMAMLLLPWIQQHINPHSGITRYAQFYSLVWHNVLTLLVILLANGLVWLVLALWSALFSLVGITFFNTLFFATDWFVYLAIGLVTALAVLLSRTQSRLVDSVQKLLTLIATGLLPLVSVLTLLFILTLPFTGLDAISRHVSAAGLLSMLAALLLLLMAMARDPQKASLPYTGALRCLIKTSLLVTPVYVLLAAWALWQRVNQYGWTPERLYGVLVVTVLLVWSLGYALSILRRKGQNPLILQGKTMLAVSLLSLAILVLLHSPVLDSGRISVNSHMARYHSGKIKPDDVTLYMLERSGRAGRDALLSLKDDAVFMQSAVRRRSLLMILYGEPADSAPLSSDRLASNVMLAPGVAKPEASFWSVVQDDQQGDCLLVEQDLNNDGLPERILFAFDNNDATVYFREAGKSTWAKKGVITLPAGMTKETLLSALKNAKVGTKTKAWRDLTVNGETLGVKYQNN